MNESLENRKDGNTFNTGPAPPPPPGTPPIRRSPTPKSGNRGSSSPSNGGDSSSSGDSKSSGLGAGGIAGIVISLLVVTALIAFFLIKRKRSKRTSSTDIERSDQNVNEPFTVASNDIHQGNNSLKESVVIIYIHLIMLLKTGLVTTVPNFLKNV